MKNVIMYPTKSRSSCELFEERFKKYELAPLPPLPTPEEACSHCFQTGFVWLLSPDSVSIWAFCDCPDGGSKKDAQDYKLPRYSIYLTGYTVKDFPVKAFYPHIHNTVEKQLWERVREFKKDLELSEKYWATK